MAKKEKKEYTGTFISHPKGYGFAEVDGFDEDFFIPEEYTNGAFHQDTVRIAVLDLRGTKRREAMITEVISHGITSVVGTYRKYDNAAFLIPDDKKIVRDIRIPAGKDLHALSEQKAVCFLTDYGDARHKPEGIIVEVIGFASEPGVDVTSIVRTFGLPTAFSDEVMTEAKEKDVPLTRRDLRKRLDLRNEVLVTIDGDDSKDLDDAVSLYKDKDNYILGVHIADVSHYVTEKSELDFEAKKRGTSVYLADRVIPMLPVSLSNGICSLNEGEDRLTLSCIMTVNPKGKVIDYEICESVIRSAKRMSYSQVNRILDDEDAETIAEYQDLVPMFRLMAELAKILNKRRMKRGSIDFDFPETVITLDEKGHPDSIRPYDRGTSNRLIEEFMLLANETVARFAYERKLPFIYRCHGTPDGEKIRELSRLLGSFGYSLKGDKDDISPKEIQHLLKKVKDTPEEKMISTVVLRSMQQARYTTECEGHFGLAADYYCHFTSPIRRYPDLMVHRILKEEIHKKIKKKRRAFYEGILPQTASECSRLERRADDTEREVDKLKKVQYMTAHVGEEFSGVISGITKWGIYVELPNTVEGMIAVSSLHDDYYEFDEKYYCLRGARKGRTFTLGENLRIMVSRADTDLRIIDFTLAEEKQKDTGKHRAKAKTAKRKPVVREANKKRTGNTKKKRKFHR